MATVDGSVEALSRAILAEARVETEELKGQALSEAETIRQRAEAEAASIRAAILEKAAHEADRLRSQALATAQLKARATELQHRELLLGRVFKRVSQELAATLQRKDYPEIIDNLIREGLSQLRVGEVVVRADAATQKLLNQAFLDRISQDTNMRLSLGKTLETGVGAIVQTPDGHLDFDNTLQTRLARLESPLRPAVYRVLLEGAA
jgi:vacuolar-type H+-ATPase subunit E/Vma4